MQALTQAGRENVFLLVNSPFAYRLKTVINPPFDISSLGHYIGEEVLKSFSSKVSFTHMHTGYLRRSLRQFHLI